MLILCGASLIFNNERVVLGLVEKREREHTVVMFPAQLVTFYGSHPQQRTMASVALTVHGKLVFDSTLPTLLFCFSVWVFILLL